MCGWGDRAAGSVATPAAWSGASTFCLGDSENLSYVQPMEPTKLTYGVLIEISAAKQTKRTLINNKQIVAIKRRRPGSCIMVQTRQTLHPPPSTPTLHFSIS